MVRYTPIPQRSRGTLTLSTDFTDSDNAHMRSEDRTLSVSFNDVRVGAVNDWKNVVLTRNGELTTTLSLEPHVARRLCVELARDGIIDPIE